MSDPAVLVIKIDGALKVIQRDSYGRGYMFYAVLDFLRSGLDLVEFKRKVRLLHRAPPEEIRDVWLSVGARADLNGYSCSLEQEKSFEKYFPQFSWIGSKILALILHSPDGLRIDQGTLPSEDESWVPVYTLDLDADKFESMDLSVIQDKTKLSDDAIQDMRYQDPDLW